MPVRSAGAQNWKRELMRYQLSTSPMPPPMNHTCFWFEQQKTACAAVSFSGAVLVKPECWFD